MDRNTKNEESKMKTVRVIRLSDKEYTSLWFLDTEGNLHETREDADRCGLRAVVIADIWRPGSFGKWKRSIMSKVNEVL